MNPEIDLQDLCVNIKMYRRRIKAINEQMLRQKTSKFNLEHDKEIYFACIERLKERANKIIKEL